MEQVKNVDHSSTESEISKGDSANETMDEENSFLEHNLPERAENVDHPCMRRESKIRQENPVNEIVNEENSFLEHSSPDGIGYWGAIAHIIRATVGTGILLLPFEMKQLGYVGGTVLLFVASIAYYHIIHILLYLDSRLRQYLKVQRLTYAVIADEIFARAPFPINKFRRSVLLIIYIYYIVPTSKSISLVIISRNIQETIKFFYDIHLDSFLVITALTLVLTTFCMFRSVLKILVPFSSTTNIFTFVIAIVIVIYSIIYRKSKVTIRPFGDTSLMFNGIVVFVNAVLSTDIMLPLKNGMKEPHKLRGHFGGVNVTGFIIVIFYFGFALIPYLNYGDDVSENILSNIPVKDWLMLSIKFGYSLALCVSYILSFYACFDVIWTSKLQAYVMDSRYTLIIEYSIRIAFNAFAYLMAVGLSNLALISAMGGIFGVLIDVTFMPLLQILLMFMLDEKNYWIICKNIVLILMSSILFFASIVDCIGEVKKLYS